MTFEMRIFMDKRIAAVSVLSVACGLAALAALRSGPAAAAPADARAASDPPAATRPDVEPGRFPVDAFGAKGDGQADDTAAVQAAVDAAAGAGGGVVAFRGGGTYLVTSVDLPPGITLDGNGATVRRPDKTPGRYTRMFTTQNRPWISDHDSPVLLVRDLTFDGNRQNQGPYLKYELEQSHLLFLMGAEGTAAKRGRLRAVVQNCTFKDSPADAVSVYTNVSVKISDCASYDCFRGGITVVGGHTVVQIHNFTGQGDTHPSGLQYEVDGGGFGNSHVTESVISNVIIDGDFDCGLAPGSTFVADNVVCRRPMFYVYAPGSRVMVSNSTFAVGPRDGSVNRIVHPGDVTFANCRFTVTEAARVKADEAEPDLDRPFAAVGVSWNISGSDHKGQRVRLLDCTFDADASLEPSDTAYAVYTTPDAPANDNRLVVDGGEVSAAFDYGLHVTQGGRVLARGVRMAADTGVYLGAPAGFPVELELDGVATSGKTSLHVGNANDQTVVTHRNAEADESRSALSTTYGLAGGNTYRGGRLIGVDADPTGRLSGLAGDRARLKTPAPGQPHEWVCTTTGIAPQAVWKPVRALAE